MIYETNLLLDIRELIVSYSPRILNIIFIFVLTGIGYFAAYISKFLPSLIPKREKTALLELLITTLLGGYTIILGLVMVACWDNFVEAERGVTGEVSALTSIIQRISAYPEKDQKEILQSVHYYIKATQQEWITMVKGKSNPEAQQALNQLNKTFIKAFPNDKTNSVTSVQIDQSLAELNAGRIQRIDQLQAFIPGALKQMIFGVAILIMLLAGFLNNEKEYLVKFHIISIALLEGLLLGISMSLDYPFSGTFSVANSFSELAIKSFM